MGKKSKITASAACCRTPVVGVRGFKVEAIASVDDRGQMVLPKSLRGTAGIGAGDPLILMSWQKDGEICCVSIVKADGFRGMLTEVLGPMMGGLSG